LPATDSQQVPEATQARAEADTESREALAAGGDLEAAPSAAEALCLPADDGSLSARIQGAIEAEIAWGRETPQCRGGLRPEGDGLRLIFKGRTPDGDPLLVVLGLSPLKPGESSRHVPVNLTLVREGAGEFFATQGSDKCALDDVRQVPVPAQPHRFRLEGRGYCTQPARSVRGDTAIFVSRFDVVAMIEGRPAEAVSTTTAANGS
jgi:hypothetical protein